MKYNFTLTKDNVGVFIQRFKRLSERTGILSMNTKIVGRKALASTENRFVVKDTYKSISTKLTTGLIEKSELFFDSYPCESVWGYDTPISYIILSDGISVKLTDGTIINLIWGARVRFASNLIEFKSTINNLNTGIMLKFMPCVDMSLKTKNELSSIFNV